MYNTTTTTTIPSYAPAASAKRSLARFLQRTTSNSMMSTNTVVVVKKEESTTSNDRSDDHTAITEACSSQSSSSSTFDILRLKPSTIVQNGCIITSSTKKETRGAHHHHIRFSPSVEQRTILGRHEYSTAELDACWFRGDEYATITRSCCKQIKKLEAGENLRDQKFCSRGLESHTRLAALAKIQSRRNAWDAVLNEQYEQLSLGVVDDEPVAQLYQHASSSSLMWAQRVGLQDQKAAALVYDDLLDEVDLVNSSF